MSIPAHRLDPKGLCPKARDRVLRADALRHDLNAGKAASIAAFVRDYRTLSVAVGRRQWRAFFEAGSTDKHLGAKDLNGVCGAAPVQMATHQAVEQVEGWLANRANEFARIVQRSTLTPETKHLLHRVNRRGAWFARGDDGVPAEVGALARKIMHKIMARHRRPDLSRISPRLDVRVATVAAPKRAKHADLWARLRVPGRGAIHVPLVAHDRFARRPGPLCPVLQITLDGDGVGFRLVSDLTGDRRASRAAYRPRTERVGIDFGLATLIATDKGDLIGRGLLDDLKRLDRQITGIARHRMRSGSKPRDSARYRALVKRVRGMVQTRVNAALNRVVTIHAPSELTVERLDFRAPGLSRRMNRLVQNCGRAVFRTKLVDLNERFGIEVAEVPSPYTSQECSPCGYVDRRNRRSQSRFECRFCGSRKHADVNAGRVITKRRSLGSGAVGRTEAAILAGLTRRFCERWRRPRGGADDPRLSNPYFREWANAARNDLLTHEVTPCAQKQ